MKKLIDTRGAMTAIGKLLAEKKNKLAEYYAFEQDNSFFDIPEEDAKTLIEEKAILKKEVRILDYYLIDIEEIQKAYQQKISENRTLELHDWCLMQALKKNHNDLLMENVKFLKETLYQGMINEGASDYLAKLSIISFLNAFVRKNYIY